MKPEWVAPSANYHRWPCARGCRARRGSLTRWHPTSACGRPRPARRPRPTSRTRHSSSPTRPLTSIVARLIAGIFWSSAMVVPFDFWNRISTSACSADGFATANRVSNSWPVAPSARIDHEPARTRALGKLLRVGLPIDIGIADAPLAGELLNGLRLYCCSRVPVGHAVVVGIGRGIGDLNGARRAAPVVAVVVTRAAHHHPCCCWDLGR